jgi:endonuclease/exonuclease/phosphatase family metal-dependent hydrolase
VQVNKLVRCLVQFASPVVLAVWQLSCGGNAPVAPSSAAPGVPATTSPSALRLRIVTWNVQHGYTPDKQHVNQQQISFLAGLKPDVVALQEMAEWDNDMPTIYRQGLQAMTGKSWSWRYEADLPHADVSRRDGNVLGTTLPVSAQDVLRLDDPSAPNDNNRNRSVIRFSISQGGVRVDVATTHLDYIDPANRRSQVDRMQAFLDRGVASRIVAGDFNAEPADATTWSGWRSEYADAWLSPANSQSGASGFTMPLRSTTGRPGRIDYQWFANAQPTHVEVVQTQLSDHYALVVDWTVTAK